MAVGEVLEKLSSIFLLPAELLSHSFDGALVTAVDEMGMVSPDFKGLEDDYLALDPHTNYPGVVRQILMIDDINKYFEVSWRRAWNALDRGAANLLAKHGVGIEELAGHDISVV